MKCAVNDKEILKSKQKTIKEKYRFLHPFQNEEVKIKIKETLIDRYGEDNAFKIKEFREKHKKTLINNYGVDDFFKSQGFIDNQREKKKKNYIEYWSSILKIDRSNIDTSNNNVIITNFCDKHDSFIIDKNNLYHRAVTYKINICTECYPITELSSIKEKELFNFIKDELKIMKILENDRKILNGKELDIYLPDHKLAIEFNGIYYHSDLFKTNNFHLNKTNMCEKEGIQLLHIFEDEWVFKQDIVKSIIKSKLGLIKKKIFGRKTIIKEITDNKLIREFLNKNHIQGFVGSNVKLGLFNDGELVSLMTFGKSRKSISTTDDSYELNRFCNKLNTNVIGGASKLLKYFIKTYKPKELISFADRRWSNGNLYEQLKFKKININPPRYFVVKPNELIRYHRFNFRKEVLIKMGGNKNKSESEILKDFNFLKIYDSGNIKYVKKYE